MKSLKIFLKENSQYQHEQVFNIKEIGDIPIIYLDDKLFFFKSLGYKAHILILEYIAWALTPTDPGVLSYLKTQGGGGGPVVSGLFGHFESSFSKF